MASCGAFARVATSPRPGPLPFELHLIDHAGDTGHARGDLLSAVDGPRLPDISAQRGHAIADVHIDVPEVVDLPPRDPQGSLGSGL
jgi:hypothetical protein